MGVTVGLQSRIVAAVVAAALVLGGCGGGDADADTPAEGELEGSGDAASDLESPETDASVDDPAPVEPTSDDAGEDVLDAEIREALGLASVTLLTPTTGQGSRPEFAWEPVNGAASYTVVLFAPEGRAYWAWEGSETSIHLGGEPLIEEGKAGPSVVDGMDWLVEADDAEGHIIAISARRAIGP